MSTDARVVVLPAGGRRLEVRDVVLPGPGPWEVLVAQQATGVCHSQLGHIAGADPTVPLVLGHESYGTVTAVGDRVTHVVPGDAVFVTWIPRNAARRPAPVTVAFEDGSSATTRNVFTWATHVVADEQYVVKAAPGLPAHVASVIGCAVMTGAGAVQHCAGLAPGESVAVWGVGGVGLVSVAAARVLGASTVVAVDIDDAKLELARKLGADHLVNAAETDALSAVRALSRTPDGIQGVDYSLDCTGRVDNVAKSLAAVRPGVPGRRQGGTLVLVGVIRSGLELSAMEILNGQKHVTGCLGGACVPDRDFAVYADWYRSGRLDLDSLVTDRYALDQINEAVEDLRGGRVLGRAVIDL